MNNNTFQHRNNQDDSWDSICPRCSLIVARVDHETQLARFEKTHTCDPAIFRKPAMKFLVFHQR